MGANVVHCIPHPESSDRKLFLAFNQCHLIKNVRSQFLTRDLGKDGVIASEYVKELYKMQQDSIIKPIRFLTRRRNKHFIEIQTEVLEEEHLPKQY